MVNIKLEEEQILKKHREVYDGGKKIYIGSTDKNPKPMNAQFLLDNPDVLRKAKSPFPFEGEILDAPDMPDIVKELVNITPEKAKKPDKTETVVKKFTKEILEGFNFSKLKRLAKKFGETGRSRTGLIKDILKHN